MKVEVSAETYQVGAHFKALIKAILVALSRILENFFFYFTSPCRAVQDGRGHRDQAQSGSGTRNAKNLSKDFKGATRISITLR